MQIDPGAFGRARDGSYNFVNAIAKDAQQAQQQRAISRAVADYQQDPNNAKAIGYLYSANPALASTLERSTLSKAETSREGEARSALADWMLPKGQQPNALSGTMPVGVSQANSPGQPSNALNALSPQAPADPLMPLPEQSPMAVQPTRMPTAMPSPGDPRWERYVRADPSGAMKTLLGRQNLTKAQNDALTSQMDVMARLARGAVDQPSYEAAMREAQEQGIDTSSLPPRFDPAAVNAIELQALSAKEYLVVQRNERRAEWDEEDDRIDNDRADRGVDSQIETRRGQLSNARRGQDLTDSRGRRGQDMTDTRGRRGQDMRPPAKGGSRSGDGAIIVNPQTGQRMKLEGGKWVPTS